MKKGEKEVVSKEVTELQINEWKKKYKRVFKYEAEDGKVCYVRQPDRKVIGYARETSGNNGIKANEAIIENIFLGGDECIKTEDKYFFGLSAKVDELIDIVTGELQEL